MRSVWFCCLVILYILPSCRGKYDGVWKFSQPLRDFLNRVATDNCTPQKCKLPSCYCSGTAIPGGLPAKYTPQAVLLTFQDAVNVQNYDAYTRLFVNRTNPNGCLATGTFFVSHRYTDYYFVQSLRSRRHEIASGVVDTGSSSYAWRNASYAQWKNHMDSQKRILSVWGGVPSYSVRGFRAPSFQLGGDRQYRALKDSGALYDSSRLSTSFSTPGHLLWPYTYDYRSKQDCVIGPCPQASFPGLWEAPILDLTDSTGQFCATPANCNVTDAQDAFELLILKFWYHYFTNRAPCLIVLPTTWLTTPYKLEGTVRFLNYIQQAKDVYMVSVNQAIQWMQKPTRTSSIKWFKPWGCSSPVPKVCNVKDTHTCVYDKNRKLIKKGGTEAYRMRTCQQCPTCYPWVNDPYGRLC